jgi:hypothetical protein
VSRDKVAAIKEMKAAGKEIAHIARVTGQANDPQGVGRLMQSKKWSSLFLPIAAA